MSLLNLNKNSKFSKLFYETLTKNDLWEDLGILKFQHLKK